MTAENIEIQFQKSEDYKLEKETFTLEHIESYGDLQVQMEALKEGPLQLTAVIRMKELPEKLKTIHLNAFRKNPYFYGRPVHFAEMFFGRMELKNAVKNRILNVVKQDILISGIRRIGKTSLLFQLNNELKASFYPVFFSLQQVGDTSDAPGVVRQLFFQF